MSDLSTPLAFVAAIVAFVGSFFFLTGAIGFVRLPDFYTRIHAPTKAASLGIPLMAFASIGCVMPFFHNKIIVLSRPNFEDDYFSQ